VNLLRLVDGGKVQFVNIQIVSSQRVLID